MRFIQKLIRYDELILGLLLIGVFIAIAAAAGLLAPLDLMVKEDQMTGLPNYFRVVGDRREIVPQPPSREAILGTSGRQVDIFYALVWGTRGALLFGLAVAFGAGITGALIGALSGLLGGWVNWLLMRLTDGFLAFPLIAGVVLFNELRRIFFPLLLPGFSNIYGAPTPEADMPLIIDLLLSKPGVFILFTWMPYARLVNGMVLRLRSSEFILAAQVLGSSKGRIILRHLIPNVLSPVIVLISRDIGAVVLLQAALSFIRFNSDSVWGSLLAFGRDWIMGSGGNPLLYWWVFLPPSLVIILFGVGWSLFGDGLNNWLNPRRQKR